MARYTTAGIIAALIASLIIWRLTESGGDAGARRGPQQRPPTAVRATEAIRGTIIKKGVFTGSLKPNSYFVMAPKVAGRLERLTVDIGDEVKRGQLIAELEDEEYAQGVQQARAELKVAEANVAQSKSALEVALREFERSKALRAKGIASESELDAARSKYEAEQAQHQVALAEVARRAAALKAAEVRLSYTRIHATWEGGSDTRVIGERFVHEGAMLSANTPIVSVLEIATLVAVVNVIEKDYEQIRVGQPAVITTDAHRGRGFPATVERIAPVLSETSRQARVELSVANPPIDGDAGEGPPRRYLAPGMFVRAEAELDRHTDAQLVPHSAIVERADQTGLFVIDTGTNVATFVPVETGIENPDMVEILSPALSQPIVTLEYRLSDGAPVNVVDLPAAATEDEDN